MSIVKKSFEAGNATKTYPEGYQAGEIGMEAPKLSEWSGEDLDALGEWVARQLIHYGPSAAFKGAGGKVDKIDSGDGRYLCENGVFKLNPAWRIGDRSEKQEKAFLARVRKRVERLEEYKKRGLNEEELAEVVIGEGGRPDGITRESLGL